MPVADNLSDTAAVFAALPDHAIVALEGPDAAAFAHVQFASDVIALPPGNWQWSVWLTPKGRVIALFALLKLAEDRIWLLLPDYPADLLAEQLRRFLFRRKVKIEVRGDLVVQGAFAAPAAANGAALGMPGDSIELDLSGAGGPRTVRVDVSTPAGSPAFAARWFAFDLAHGLPRLPESQREQWTPQQLSLEGLPAFSVKKGCYPGQEIVARTHFLGQAKRRLVLVESDVALSAGADVESDGKAIGKIVSAPSSAPWQALAVLPLERGEIALREIPLQEGLRR